MKWRIALLLVALAGIASAQDLKKDEFSVSIGYLFEGELYLAEFDAYGSVGESALIKMEYDHYFSSTNGRLGLGLYTQIGFPYYWGETVTMIEGGLAIRGRFNAGENFMIKPGVFAGYRTYTKDTGTGLGVNGSIAVEYQKSSVKPFLDIGFLSQPAGGNSATDITFSPTFQVSAGLTF